MRKIKELNLKNFQSHADSTITFDDYNIIHGPTNAGKSSIIRAIKWALYNVTPAEGVEIRRFGTKETSVTVTFDDGRKIIRRRTNKDNEYILIDENGNEQKFTQFGRGALKEVQDFHGMYQVNLFNEPQSVNIVDQDEPPFFLSQGPTARGHLISRLAGTLVYESALILMRRDASTISKQVEADRLSLEREQEDIKALSYIDELKTFINENDVILSEAEAQKNSASSIRNIVSSIDMWKNNYILNDAAASIASEVMEASAVLDEISKIQTYIKDYRDKMTNLNKAMDDWQAPFKLPFNIDDIQSLNEMVSQLEDAVKHMSDIDNSSSKCLDLYKSIVESMTVLSMHDAKYDEITAIIAEAEQQFNLIKSMRLGCSDVNSETDKYSKCLSDSDILHKTIENLAKQYKDCLEEAGVCPTCHQTIHSGTINEAEFEIE